MSVLKSIEVIAYFKEDVPIPIKFRYEERGEWITVRVDKILNVDEYVTFYVYRCESFINDIGKNYKLRYGFKNCRWFLCKA